MPDRYTRDELLEHAHDFDDSLPEQGERTDPMGASTATNPPSAAGTFGSVHYFVPFAHKERTGCARCGRPKDHEVHRHHPAVEDAAVLSALDRAAKSLREGNRHYAQQETAFALRVLRGET